MISFFHKIIDTLNGCQIPYMLSGSVAMSLYIVPRSTRDFDFIIHLQQAGINSFVEAFREGYYCDTDAVIDAVNNSSLFNIIDYAYGYKADFVILKNEPFRQEEFRRRIQIDFYGRPVYVVSPEDLLISKLIWIQDLQSPIQMEDVAGLTAIEGLNWPYIRNWVKILKLNTFGLIKT